MAPPALPALPLRLPLRPLRLCGREFVYRRDAEDAEEDVEEDAGCIELPSHAAILNAPVNLESTRLEKGFLMQVMVCSKCGTQNRVDENRLATSEAKCGRCGQTLTPTADSKPVNITDQTFEREVLKATGKPVLVDCWAPWCPPCRAIAPVLDQLAAESEGNYRIAKLNVDENPQISSSYQISSIPTMLIFKDGKLIDRLVGAQPKQAIAERLRLATKFAA